MNDEQDKKLAEVVIKRILDGDVFFAGNEINTNHNKDNEFI